MSFTQNVVVHKANTRETDPLVSIVLLDWSVREWFQALRYLPEQDVARDKYELIWVEIFDRVVPEAMEHADAVITCGQKGIYHKHLAYNVGVLHARGKVVTVCDSDAVFTPDFVRSIIDSFGLEGPGEPESLVLMHHEWRTRTVYPGHLASTDELHNYKWLDLWPNAGACMTVRKSDAIRFGGFDEHKSLRGYLCGPYELGWRMVNAGIPEVWHDEKIALWHFAHPDPPGSSHKFSWKLWREVGYPHVDYHALTAVEAFSTGRLLPLQENPEIYEARMAMRRIGTKYEEKYSRLTGPAGYSRAQKLRMHGALVIEPFKVNFNLFWFLKRNYWRTRDVVLLNLLMGMKKVIGPRRYDSLKAWWHSQKDKKEAV